MGVEGRPADPNAPQPQNRHPRGDAALLRNLPNPAGQGPDIPGGRLGRRAGGRAQRIGRTNAVCRRARARTAHSARARSHRGQLGSSPWYTVVGVTADVRNGQALTDEPDPEIYLVARPGRGAGSRSAALSLRTTARPADADAFLRQIAADLDPKQLVTIETGDEQLDETHRAAALHRVAADGVRRARAAAGGRRAVQRRVLPGHATAPRHRRPHRDRRRAARRGATGRGRSGALDHRRRAGRFVRSAGWARARCSPSSIRSRRWTRGRGRARCSRSRWSW